jgi:stearoyl-CoA desaturase (delta-9 desaturase)
MENKQKKICWVVTLFLILNPLISITALVLYFTFSTSYTGSQVLAASLFTAIYCVLTNLSITMGYHRLFSHKSYEAHPVLQAVLLFVGAGAFQGSALKWSSDHRVHHRFEDTDKDPYAIQRGFWHAHMGWMMKHETVSLPISAIDLEKNKLVKLQHDYYILCALGVGYILPMIIGYFLGNAFLGLFMAGGLRIFLTQQSTFLVNSLSHMHGKSTYSKEKTARDSLIVTILTHGEGYHNFHHKFQFDYRNGIRWYHWVKN